MTDQPAANSRGESYYREFASALARSATAALLFSLPMLMTMELWWLGFYLPPLRLVLLLIWNTAMLFALAWFSGYRSTIPWYGIVLDVLVSYAVGFVIATAALALMGLIKPYMHLSEIAGKIAIQAAPASLGAMVAMTQIRPTAHLHRGRVWAYGRSIFIKLLGALFIALSLSSTEEMILIAFKMPVWLTVALLLVSLLVLHVFIYTVEYQQREEQHGRSASQLRVFLQNTLVTYMAILLVGFYILWTFDRVQGMPLNMWLAVAIVVALPGVVGAGLAPQVL